MLRLVRWNALDESTESPSPLVANFFESFTMTCTVVAAPGDEERPRTRQTAHVSRQV